MICPECTREFPWHVLVCPHCGVDLVERLPGPDPNPAAELVSVWSSGDAGLVGLAKSLLDAEGIDYVVKNEGIQDLIGGGRGLRGLNPVTGPVEFLVRVQDAERVGEILADLGSSAWETLDPRFDEPPGD